MTYTATREFTGVVGGAEVAFHAGDIISADDAEEMNLASKPDLASEDEE
jgi:hypothetical protein